MIQRDFVPAYETLFASIHWMDPISMHLHSYNLRSMVSTLPLLSLIQSQEEAWETQLASLMSSCSDFLTPEDLSCR